MAAFVYKLLQNSNLSTNNIGSYLFCKNHVYFPLVLGRIYEVTRKYLAILLRPIKITNHAS